MYEELSAKLTEAGTAKVTLLSKSPTRYFIASLLAGFYVGLGILLIMTIGGLTQPSGMTYRILMGLSFGISLSLVIMAGSELFTGNNLLSAPALLSRKITLGSTLSLWIYSYLGNLSGAVLVSALYVGTQLGIPEISSFITTTAQAKMALSPASAFFRGVLCNILVCLAVICSLRLKEETAKLIMIFWCLFAFITTGFEHSVANMTVFATALMIPHPPTISLFGALHNLLWVTLGNIVGGFGLGAVYYWIGRK